MLSVTPASPSCVLSSLPCQEHYTCGPLSRYPAPSSASPSIQLPGAWALVLEWGKGDEARTGAQAVQDRPECHAKNGFICPMGDKDPSQISRQ